MANRDQLMAALRNAHEAGDTEAATRIAGMIKAAPTEQAAPQGAVTPEPQPQAAPEAPQQPQEQSAFDTIGEGFAGAGRAIAGGVAGLANVGVSAANAVKSAGAWAGKELGIGTGEYTPIAPAGYGDLDQYLQPKNTAEKVAADVITYAAGGEIAAPERAAVEAGRLARLGSSAMRNLSGSAVGTVAEHNQGNDATGLATDLAVNTVGGMALEGVGSQIKRLIPRSVAEQAADVVNPEALARTTQAGDEGAQAAYQAGTTNEAGRSILNPSQVFNTEAGGKYIAAEQRDLARGTGSQYAQNLEAQRSGAGIERAVNAADTGTDLQQVAGETIGAFKERASNLYNTSKQQTQDILSQNNINRIKLGNTTEVAQKHLTAHAEQGAELTTAARKVLKKVQNTKITNIDVLDNLKRSLNEARSEAMKTGKQTSVNALTETVNSLRNEADSVIQSINPEAGSIYRDADSYFSAMAGDFGNKSALNKIAGKENQIQAENIMLGSNSLAGRFQGTKNTQDILSAIDTAESAGNLPAGVGAQMREALGNTTRNRAYAEATTGENFSPTKFTNRLAQTEAQAGAAGQGQVNQALRDVIETARTNAQVTTPLRDTAANVMGRLAGGAVGHTVGGMPGAYVGQGVGAKVSGFVNSSVLDRLAGTTRNADRIIQFISDPTNARQVENILTARNYSGFSNAPARAIEDAVNTARRGAVGAYQGDGNTTPQQTPSTSQNGVQSVTGAYTAPAAEPEQRAQSATQFEPKITRLYKSLAHAETGGLDNRFIRTKAAESGTSTAYGPAQLTVSTLDDFYKRHPDLFSEQEKDYIHRFSAQGHKMMHADKNDPVFGYGGTGILNSKPDQRLYGIVVRKMLQQMVKDNGGSLDKTVKRWRGNDTDHKYFAKVLAAYKEA